MQTKENYNTLLKWIEDKNNEKIFSGHESKLLIQLVILSKAIQIQCDPHSSSNDLPQIYRTNIKKIHIDPQKTPNSQSTPDRKEEEWCYRSPKANDITKL